MMEDNTGRWRVVSDALDCCAKDLNGIKYDGIDIILFGDPVWGLKKINAGYENGAKVKGNDDVAKEFVINW